jgi:hypothetical protein
VAHESTTTSWTSDALTTIGRAEELGLASLREDGTLRPYVTIWVVRVGDELYVRSWRGTGGSWFRAAQQSGQGHVSAGGVDRDVAYIPADDEVNDAVDAAYRDKYGRYPSYVEPMVAPPARATTLRIAPAGKD